MLVILGFVGYFWFRLEGCDSKLGELATQAARPAPAVVPTAPRPPEGPSLVLHEFHWQKEYGYAIAEGAVENISGRAMKSVQAVVTFKTANGQFVTSDEALIEYDPILPGQVSPFKVMARYNPAMQTASVDFKELFGGSIPWKKK